jgi:hypothetical protein
VARNWKVAIVAGPRASGSPWEAPRAVILLHRAAERISRLGLLETTSETPCRLIGRLRRRFPI